MKKWSAKSLLLCLARQLGRQGISAETALSPPCLSEDRAHEACKTDQDQARLSPEDADDLSIRLSDCATALPHTCSDVENDFLEIGNQLQNICSQAKQLTQNAKATVAQMGFNNQDNILTSVTQSAGRAMIDLENERARVQHCLGHVLTITDHLLKLFNVIGGIKQISKSLKMVAININIESSRWAESEQGFMLLAQEIRTLSNTVAIVARNLFGEIDAMRGKWREMHRVINQKLTAFQKLVQSAKTALDHATPQAQALINRSLQSFTAISRHAQALSQSVGEVVVNLQIHDNIRQRIEHIVKAFADAQQLLAQLSNKNDPYDDDTKTAATIDANIKLQCEQLIDILSDIDCAYQHTTEAFHKIGQTIEGITASVSDIVLVDAYCQNDDQNASSSIGSLKVALEKIRDLIGQGCETADEFKVITQDAAAAVERITNEVEQVRNVNDDIQLKALNAILESMHLGHRGKAVEVLVQEMKELADQSNHLVAQVETINQTIMEATSELQRQMDANDGDHADEAIGSGNDLEAGVVAFADSCTTMMHNAESAGKLSNTLTRQIRATGSDLEFLKRFAGDLNDQMEHLEKIRYKLAPWTEAGSRSAELDKERISARYTMQKERDILDVVINEAAAEPQAASTAKADAEAVEIATQTQKGVDETEANESDDNIELF